MLILACDGVWDVFTDQEAADLLLERYLVEGPFEDAANMLVGSAQIAYILFLTLFLMLPCMCCVEELFTIPSPANSIRVFGCSTGTSGNRERKRG
jgi:hypothetical protein